MAKNNLKIVLKKIKYNNNNIINLKNPILKTPHTVTIKLCNIQFEG